MDLKTRIAAELETPDRAGGPTALALAPSAFVGNDVVDLANARGREPLERAWMERHLTPWERESLGVPSPVAFWSIFSAKEAGYKAFAQGGFATPRRSFAMIEADLAGSRVRHLPSGKTAELLHLTVTADCVHTVALFSPEEGLTLQETVLTGIAYVPEAAEPSEYARERLLSSIAAALPPSNPSNLSLGTRGGLPKVIRDGRWENWSVSLSHSGRLAAWAWVGPSGEQEEMRQLEEA